MNVYVWLGMDYEVHVHQAKGIKVPHEGYR